MSEAHVGKVVDGRYRLDRLLGEGAAGAVYAATQLSVDRMVAVKLLHEANTERFAAEAKAIAKLNHTNVITLHDFGFDSELGAHFMVTEYAEGIPLSERMREVMSTDLILQISLEVASALHHAHANGVQHRDLKPENVILARADGRVDVAKVLDFGLAHLMAPAEPEEQAAPADVDTRADTVAMGAVAEETAVMGSASALAEQEPEQGAAPATMIVPPRDHEDMPTAMISPAQLRAELEMDSEESAEVEAAAAPAEADAPHEEEDDVEEEEVAVTTAMKSSDVDDALLAAAPQGAIKTRQAVELDTAVLPPMDLSADSMFGEEE